jgi:protein SCO1/2
MTKGVLNSLFRGAVFVLGSTLFLTQCGLFSGKDYSEMTPVTLQNQEGAPVELPSIFEDKITLVGFVYTHCPDICPMVTYNMRDVSNQIDDDRFQLISISFDPRRDTPALLASYAQSYKLSLEHWHLVTGQPTEVEQVMETLGIAVVKQPSSFLNDGEEMYFIDHSDKVLLIDDQARLVDEYVGSTFDIEEVTLAAQELLKSTS